MRSTLILISVALLISCQDKPEENIYYAPQNQAVFEETIFIDVDLETLWNRITEDSNKIFQNEQKTENIGELIFELKPKNISDYIDCGMMNEEIYVNYIDRIFESSLNIKTSLYLKKEKEKLTSIRINSKYIFKSKETGTTWIFQTNEPKLILVGNPAYGAEPYRACSSKNFLESSIIKEITELE